MTPTPFVKKKIQVENETLTLASWHVVLLLLSVVRERCFYRRPFSSAALFSCNESESNARMMPATSGS